MQIHCLCAEKSREQYILWSILPHCCILYRNQTFHSQVESTNQVTGFYMECNTKLKWVSTLFERLIHFQQEKGLFSILISLHQSIHGNATGCTLKESSRKSFFFFRVLQVFCFNRTWTFILTKNVFLGKRCISNAKCAYWKYKQIHTITAARYT